MDSMSPAMATTALLILAVSMTTVHLTNGMLACHEESSRISKVNGCVVPLKNALTASKPSDINEFLCSSAHKPDVDCVVKEINQCPALLTEHVIAEFTSGDFMLSDLAKVSSADAFCECAPTLQCLDGIDLDMLTATDVDAAYQTMHNIQYACSVSDKAKQECVMRALPDCRTYLQAKRDKFTDEMVQAVLTVQDLADKHCDSIMSNYTSGSYCVTSRSHTLGFQRCNEGANLYKKAEDRGCGLYRCVAMLMKTCADGWMEYYMDSVNVFLEEKITTEGCPPVSSAAAIVASFSLLAVSAVIARF